ncbi:hypothetical protein [Thiomicrorhabdus xiamenensis]|uniref:Uncharacterized protein n=1 Tax=Thiomicrorhabdus xiamenensis TaxID=2739063 RepID=A0A7D4SZS9_9GAMM|nr:hypothetical protein [Thiomicrorhabdus xiamenensis]QKI90224.1 hypothetical protein HQN79_11920 [Thiomicrorhabdus xiamenensis]
MESEIIKAITGAAIILGVGFSSIFLLDLFFKSIGKEDKADKENEKKTDNNRQP